MEFKKVISAWIVFARDFVDAVHHPACLSESLHNVFSCCVHLKYEHLKNIFLKIWVLQTSHIGFEPGYYMEEFQSWKPDSIYGLQALGFFQRGIKRQCSVETACSWKLKTNSFKLSLSTQVSTESYKNDLEIV